MMAAIVIDLDGTLCDCSHRVQHAQAKDWDAFYEGLMGDKVVEPVRELLECMTESLEILLVTGRPEKYRVTTERWLQDNFILWDALLMRPRDDWRHDYEVKLALLEAHFGSKEIVLERVLFALDDRDQVVEAFRNYGLSCWQVRQGDY
jgi:FMN phosphatase YigB (HAD superfamily)